MDETKELFNKIKGKDTASFHLLTETYGWKLYSYIRRNVSDREQADRIFNDTLSQFHNSVGDYNCEDPIEAMLCFYADQVGKKVMQQSDALSSDMGPWEIAQEREFTLPETDKKARRKKKKQAKTTELRGGSGFSNFFYGLCVILLIVGIIAALWFLVGILVDMHVLPEQWDFGYSWFNTHIAHWF